MHNRLGDTLSPYLLAHAGNPVAWQPWDEAAFALAREKDKPIFLSIGYATCHWCHVMERESFEDDEVARAINETFVPIKVDREERPDVDAVYMEAAQLASGRGGWPLTVLLTPDARPFFVATYLPPRSRYGRAGVLELAEGVGEAWQQRRDEVEASSQAFTDALRARWDATAEGDAMPGEDTLHRAFAQLRQRYDAEAGGFGAAPKFPTPHVGRFLLRYGQRYDAPEAHAMVVHTLRAMRAGGLFDQLGYGFHRYSTDRTWKLPHFEKMLYDQAGLLALYAEAAAVTDEPEFARVVEEIVHYVSEDLMSAEGAFFAAEDADSEGREGAFYVWRHEELVMALGSDAERVVDLYHVTPEGNFEEEATGERTGENVLFLHRWPSDAENDMAALRARLLAARETRPRPLLDDKILTDWNSYAIAALARAGDLLGETRYMAMAERAMKWLLSTLRTPEGRLLHRARNGQVGLSATADDYAATIRALLDLYQATQHPLWLNTAVELQQHFDTYYYDSARGAYLLAASDAPPLITQPFSFYDGATPSANSLAALNGLHLARLTGQEQYAERARRLLATAAEEVQAMPSGFAQLLLALDEAIHAPPDVVLTIGPAADAADFLEVLSRCRQPGSLTVVLDAERRESLLKNSPYLAAYKLPESGVKAYVCQNLQCEAPVAVPQALEALLCS